LDFENLLEIPKRIQDKIREMKNTDKQKDANTMMNIQREIYKETKDRDLIHRRNRNKKLDEIKIKYTHLTQILKSIVSWPLCLILSHLSDGMSLLTSVLNSSICFYDFIYVFRTQCRLGI